MTICFKEIIKYKDYYLMFLKKAGEVICFPSQNDIVC